MSNDIKELIPRLEQYDGKISEKNFIKSIKNCKYINLNNMFVTKQYIKNDIDLDCNNGIELKNKIITIKGYIELNIRDCNKSKNKLDFIIGELSQMKDNIYKRLDNIENRLDNVENRLDNIENRLDNVEKDIRDIKSCPTIQKELKEVQKTN